jgi:hypothetical protein
VAFLRCIPVLANAITDLHGDTPATKGCPLEGTKMVARRQRLGDVCRRTGANGASVPNTVQCIDSDTVYRWLNGTAMVLVHGFKVGKTLTNLPVPRNPTTGASCCVSGPLRDQ